MVNLDYLLIHTARRLMNGANVHRLKEMIFAYQQSVDLYNRRTGPHVSYDDRYEKALRQYVARRRRIR